MAIGATRVHGDSQAVVSLGNLVSKSSNTVIINTGIASPINVYRIEVVGNLAAELGKPNASGVPGAVETLVGYVAANASVLAYQVDATPAATAGALGAQLSIIVERSGWEANIEISGNAVLQSYIRAQPGAANIGAYGTVTTTNALVFDRGLKLSRQ